jgi:hypothetical protein
MAERKAKKQSREESWIRTIPLPYTVLGPDDPPSSECPARMSSSAKHVASVCWSWSPANDRLDEYYITSNAKRTHWVLWFGYQHPLDYRQVREPRAYCSKEGLSDKAAAMLLLFMLFRRDLDAHEDPGLWDEVKPGLLSAEEMSTLAAMIWSRPKEEAN